MFVQRPQYPRPASPTMAALLVLLAVLPGLHCRNASQVSDPLGRVTLRYHLYPAEVRPTMQRLQDVGRTVSWLKEHFQKS